MNRAGLVLLALAAALVLGGLGFWLGRQAPVPAAAAGDAPAPEPKVAAASGAVARERGPERARAPAEPAAPAPPPPSSALPPPNAPVAQVYDQLAARARTGDSRAACRLANDLSACRTLSLLREQREGFDRSLLQETSKANRSDQRIKQLLTQQEQLGARIADSERQCGGLPQSRIDEAFDWLKLAADQGHVPSMARFATDPMIPLNRMVKEADRIMLYRANAPRYAQAALAAGNVDVVAALAEAYRTKSPSGGTVLSQVMPADPVQSFAYATLARRLAPVALSPGSMDPLELQRGDLDPDQLEQAQRLSDDLYARYFANRPAPAKPGGAFDVGAYWCERDR